MDKNKKAMLIALVLGDGFIKVDTRRKNHVASLKICHSIKQKELVEYKATLLHSYLGGRYPKINEYECNLNGVLFKQLRFEKAHRYFKVLRRWMYPNKYAILKYLTPQAIALWYMDDGSIVVNNRYPDGSFRSARTNIHTCCKTRDVAQAICDYFQQRWGIKFSLFNEKGLFSIRCFHREGEKFHKLIHPFVIPSMSYKQRFYYDTSA